jgi:nitrite reductase/ring-hydroxylating ferredoxin subunit
MNDWIEIAKIDDIPRQGSRVVEIGTPAADDGAVNRIALFRTVTDEIYAMRDKCPHRGGPLSEASSTAGWSPAHCTVSRSTSPPARRCCPTRAAPGPMRPRWKAARCF